MKAQIAEIKHKLATEKGSTNEASTIFEEVLNTPKLPDREKTVERLWQDGSTVIGAGTETTAWSTFLSSLDRMNKYPYRYWLTYIYSTLGYDSLCPARRERLLQTLL